VRIVLQFQITLILMCLRLCFLIKKYFFDLDWETVSLIASQFSPFFFCARYYWISSMKMNLQVILRNPLKIHLLNSVLREENKSFFINSDINCLHLSFIFHGLIYHKKLKSKLFEDLLDLFYVYSLQ